MRGSSRQRTTVVGLMAMALAVPAVLVAPAVTAQESYATSAQLQQDVRLNRVLRHLDRFQRIAEENGGNRASGTPGYDASARYVYGELQKAGYNVTFQDFPFRAYRPLAPTVVRTGLADTYRVRRDRRLQHCGVQRRWRCHRPCPRGRRRRASGPEPER